MKLFMLNVLMSPTVARSYKPDSFIVASFKIFVIFLRQGFLVYL